MEIELYGKDYPVTVANFIDNIDKNIYSNQKFYKTINYSQVSFIHGGFNTRDKFYDDRSQILNKLSHSIPLEIKFKGEIKPRYKYQIKNPFETKYLTNTFRRGSIAMVKRGKNNSSASEFFFVTNKIPELDGRYSIFGQVIKGFDVLEKIKKGDTIQRVQLSN